MTPSEYISTQEPERQAQMTALHEAIIANDKNVEHVVEPMMGKEMIIYKERCYMKYGLAGVKKHMSLHCLPMYMMPDLYTRFTDLLPQAKFQKGCINFSGTDDFPVDVASVIIRDCAVVNIAEVLENRNKKKK